MLAFHVEIITVARLAEKKKDSEEERRKMGFQHLLVCRSRGFGVIIYAIVSFPFGR